MNKLTPSNLHLFLAPIVSESRFFKEADYLLNHEIFEFVTVLGLWSDGLPVHEKHKTGPNIFRHQPLIRRLRSLGYLKNPGLFRKILAGIGLFEYMYAALKLAYRQKPSHLSVHNLVLLPISVLIAKLFKIKLIYVPHELETERTGLDGVAKLISIFIEKHLIGFCSKIVVVCDPIAEWYKGAYSLCNVYVVRNVPRRVDVLIMNSVNNDFRSKFNIINDSIIYIYQGLIEKSRGADDLVKAFEKTTHHLVFMGYGGYVDALRNCRKTNIHYQEAVPINRITSYTSSADVGIFVVDGIISISYKFCLPNKFFEYLHAGIPVIVSSNMTYLSELVLKNDLGWVIKSDDLATTINSITQNDVEVRKASVRHFVGDCVWENDAQAYLQVYA